MGNDTVVPSCLQGNVYHKSAGNIGQISTQTTGCPESKLNPSQGPCANSIDVRDAQSSLVQMICAAALLLNDDCFIAGSQYKLVHA